ncbi:hypothetical protein DEIPH_ctg046orf0020 [Deinococcus phoenicis]|uniref:Uncharacterized protein n=1 Tax=Deinococcus phoenicis TaxID=1476583 RepID=A0A016QMD4_9DEIO|nr:hypothetical protein DEIPH_ctg046orf0020 [Deinococcus phoenicis]
MMTLWRGPQGTWQGRLKSLRDGEERLVADLRELLAVLGTASAGKDDHAQT